MTTIWMWLVLGMSFAAAAGGSVCDSVWGPRGQDTEKVFCQLEGKNTLGETVGLEWIRIKNGCGMEGEKPKTCYFVRECDLKKGKNGFLGEGILRVNTSKKDLCIGANQATPLYGKKPDALYSELLCGAQQLPEKVLLKVHGAEKLCDFPKDFK